MIASDLVYEDDFTTGAAAQQIQSYNYSPNNVNTIYPNEKFNKKAPTPNHDAPSGGCPSGRNAAQVAVYTNEPDSHSGSQAGDWEEDEDEELITVSSKTGAMAALLTNCEQGEGHKDDQGAEETTADPDQNSGEDLHACMGLNSCAGQDRYGKDGAPGFSPNSCAGQGYCATTQMHSCHTNNNCAGQGGCRLYGSESEVSQPGQNDCRSMGSCNPRSTPNGSSLRAVYAAPVFGRVRAECSQRRRKQQSHQLDRNPLHLYTGRPLNGSILSLQEAARLTRHVVQAVCLAAGVVDESIRT